MNALEFDCGVLLSRQFFFFSVCVITLSLVAKIRFQFRESKHHFHINSLLTIFFTTYQSLFAASIIVKFVKDIFCDIKLT